MRRGPFVHSIEGTREGPLYESYVCDTLDW